MHISYTKQAANAVRYAAKKAKEMKHPYIGTEHLLLGLREEFSGVAGQVLAQNGVETEKIMQLMDELFSWMKEAREDVHPLILSSVFHYEFVFIHPFADGNGRMARLWHTAILSKWKSVFEYIPIESQIEKFQDEYYEAISKCHVAGESTIFIEFMLSQIDKILDDISAQISEKSGYLPETLQKLLEVMEYDVPYTGNELMKCLGLKAKEGFRRNYLHPAIEMNLIQMTIPDKPNSRNQRYIRR